MTINVSQIVRNLPDSAVELFAVLSRFECALKRAGYCEPTEEAKPSWNAFAERLGKPFFEKISASHQADTLLLSPPKKQIQVNRRLDWAGSNRPANVHEVFVMVRRVRNNLFHGGKYPSGPVSDVSRDERLLRESLWVIESALAAAPDVSAEFESWMG